MPDNTPAPDMRTCNATRQEGARRYRCVMPVDHVARGQQHVGQGLAWDDAPAPDAPAARDENELQRNYFAILDALHSWRLSSHIGDSDDVILCGFLSRLRTAFNALCEAYEETADAAEARAVRCECVIRDAAHLMATRMEGTPIVESYGAAYRVLFGYLYPDAPLPNASKLEAW